MANISPQANGPLGADITRIDTVPQYSLGHEFKDLASGTVYRYCKSTGALAQYGLSKIDSGHIIGVAQTPALAGTTAPLLLGAPQMSGGFTAANQYGWVAVQGLMYVLGKATTAANSLLYLSTVTAGYVTTTVTAPKLNNLYLTATVGGADASVQASANGYITTLP